MPIDANARDLTLAVVGTGTMGRGIVQVSAQGGMNVIAYDEKPGGAAAAKDFTAKMLDRQVEKGSLSPDDARAAVGRISVANTLEDVAKANVIIEAIFERLDIKQEMFAKLDAITRPDTIIATNTSSLPVTSIAAKTKRPERIGGMHFFNPVPLMRLVEVIPGLRTAPWVTEALMTIGRRMTREPILCTDSPGFLVNHIGRGMGPECQRILVENIASHADIDRIMTGAPGFRMGPFTLADLVGIDVNTAATPGVHVRAVLSGAGVCTLAAVGSAVGRRALRPEDGRRLVQLQGRQDSWCRAGNSSMRAFRVLMGMAVLGCIAASATFAFEFGWTRGATDVHRWTYALAGVALDLLKAGCRSSAPWPGRIGSGRDRCLLVGLHRVHRPILLVRLWHDSNAAGREVRRSDRCQRCQDRPADHARPAPRAARCAAVHRDERWTR